MKFKLGNSGKTIETTVLTSIYRYQIVSLVGLSRKIR